jgi:hypothetical protein
MSGLNTPLTNGVTEDTAQSIILGAGTIHKGLAYNESTGWNFAASLIGATGGGNKLKITPNIIDIEPDGSWVKVAGMQVKVGETATLEITPIEISRDLIKMAAFADDGTSDAAGYDQLVSKEFLTAGDYIENFGWVAQRLDGGPVIVRFPLAYCSGGLEIGGASKDKSVPTMTIECVQAAGGNSHILPYQIYTLSEPPAQG